MADTFKIQNVADGKYRVDYMNSFFFDRLVDMLNIPPSLLRGIYIRNGGIEFVSHIMLFKYYLFNNICDAQNFINDLEPYIMMSKLS